LSLGLFQAPFLAHLEVTPGKMTRVNCSVESDHKVVY
jgi:hypothetical protein